MFLVFIALFFCSKNILLFIEQVNVLSKIIDLIMGSVDREILATYMNYRSSESFQQQRCAKHAFSIYCNVDASFEKKKKTSIQMKCLLFGICHNSLSTV